MWQVIHLASVDSTNDELKRRARAGERGPLAVTALAQTGGKGRRGRSFQSLEGKGLYLSALFTPQAPPETVAQLTAWSAVATARAVEAASGVEVDIKWPNDVLAGDRKLCGILTELVEDRVIVGIGVNLTQTAADFGPELRDKAVSLAQLGASVGREDMARALLGQLEAMAAAFPQGREDYLAHYRRRCATLGREVRLISPAGERTAMALDVEEDFSLRVRLPGGGEEVISSGEVSVRGLLGYGSR